MSAGSVDPGARIDGRTAGARVRARTGDIARDLVEGRRAEIDSDIRKGVDNPTAGAPPDATAAPSTSQARTMRTDALHRRARRPGTTTHRVLLAGTAACLALGLAGCTSADPGPSQPTRTADPRPPATTSAPSTPTPAPVPPTTALRAAVFARLPDGARTAPAFTWDSSGKVGQGQAVENDDKVILLAAACDSGGALTITIRTRSTRLDCSRAASIGPIDVSAAIASDAPSGVDFTVRPTSGRPRYIAEAVLVDPPKD